MSVEAILAGKNRSVVTIEPARTVAEAADILSRHRIGAVVVVDREGRVAGILSERDIVRAVAERGAAALDGTVGDQMTREVVTCTASTAATELMTRMTEGKFRHIPVVREGRLDGIVSIGDLVKHRLAEVESEHQALREYIANA